jgi:hypothetical protein
MRRGFGALALVAAIAAPAAHAAPFSFLERPTDQIAVPGYVSGTTVTPEGSLYTGWAELVFRYGPRLREVDAPVRELMDGRLPVVVYSFAASDCPRPPAACACTGACVDPSPPSPARRSGWPRSTGSVRPRRAARSPAPLPVSTSARGRPSPYGVASG